MSNSTRGGWLRCESFDGRRYRTVRAAERRCRMPRGHRTRESIGRNESLRSSVTLAPIRCPRRLRTASVSLSAWREIAGNTPATDRPSPYRSPLGLETVIVNRQGVGRIVPCVNRDGRYFAQCLMTTKLATTQERRAQLTSWLELNNWQTVSAVIRNWHQMHGIEQIAHRAHLTRQ